jgi:2-oxo-4-hydroxy-4-carboxy--5-ureidoimidazoline (OHCU) decarboxylase
MAGARGAFTRALRDADLEKREEYLRRHPILAGRQRQGIASCPICRSVQPCTS